MKYCIIIILWVLSNFPHVKKYINPYHVSPTVHIIEPDQWATCHKKGKQV
ncbi:protein of unknown function [Cardinium endosymbiont cEper1 of Encarsia pergandiella]|nr:protein of unknown function [Cardinium endosymbiont cEper1 of Encarsia pergandiella]